MKEYIVTIKEPVGSIITINEKTARVPFRIKVSEDELELIKSKIKSFSSRGAYEITEVIGVDIDASPKLDINKTLKKVSMKKENEENNKKELDLKDKSILEKLSILEDNNEFEKFNIEELIS